MLGVRRVGITGAAGLLQRDGLIEYRRGEVIILNRHGLEAAACGCYDADQLSYSTHLH
jgi:Mn-dependent DtxR family transcriptional regulator